MIDGKIDLLLALICGLLIFVFVRISDSVKISTLVESGRCEYRADSQTDKTVPVWGDTGDEVGKEKEGNK